MCFCSITSDKALIWRFSILLSIQAYEIYYFFFIIKTWLSYSNPWYSTVIILGNEYMQSNLALLKKVYVIIL